MSTAEKLEYRQRRRDRRHAYERYVFYATENRLYQGNVKNYSRGGMRIYTRHVLTVGRIVTVALPYAEDKDEKRKAQVVWANRHEFSLSFFPTADEAIDVLRF